MKKTKMMKVPEEFFPVLETAKRELKALTGKKKATDADGFRYIAGASKLFSYKKFSFEKEDKGKC